MIESREIFFRDRMKQEANDLLSQIKQESDQTKKYQLCESLLEILEELDIEVSNNHSLWQEIQMSYQDFV